MSGNVHKKWSKISMLHSFKLVFRSALLIAAIVLYLINRINKTGQVFGGVENNHTLLMAIWLIFVIEMLLRFFPSKIESPGCQKMFASTYVPAEPAEAREPAAEDYKGPFLIAMVWIGFNLIFGVLYMLGIFDGGIMMILSLAYSVCDMICILFFCPFQTWFMKNKCCSTCRIYNWDFAMMFTPLIFVRTWYTWSILIFALGLFVKWEWVYYFHPERFSESCNLALTCAGCPEKLCAHKKQLRKLHLQLRELSVELLTREKKELEKTKLELQKVRIDLKKATDELEFLKNKKNKD